MSLLEVKHLKKYYQVNEGLFRKEKHFKAVDDVSFSIEEGETFGLVGESGCGKTTVGKSILRLTEPTGGEVLLNGQDLVRMDKQTLRSHRKEIQMIFQDPYSSLNPQMNVEAIISEPFREYKLAQGNEVKQQVRNILEMVGINQQDMKKYPHEFSGGQRQRIVIARALAAKPKLIVCDEPVSALDVSVQAQILNLMRSLQKELGIAYLFIAHGMPVVRHISHKVGVMYLGKLVEVSPSKELFSHSLHPYTQALLSAVPLPDPTQRQQRIVLSGEVPNLINPPNGCLFSNRCRYCTQLCKECAPELKEVTPNHWVACHKIAE